MSALDTFSASVAAALNSTIAPKIIDWLATKHGLAATTEEISAIWGVPSSDLSATSLPSRAAATAVTVPGAAAPAPARARAPRAPKAAAVVENVVPCDHVFKQSKTKPPGSTCGKPALPEGTRCKAHAKTGAKPDASGGLLVMPATPPPDEVINLDANLFERSAEFFPGRVIAITDTGILVEDNGTSIVYHGKWNGSAILPLTPEEEATAQASGLVPAKIAAGPATPLTATSKPPISRPASAVSGVPAVPPSDIPPLPKTTGAPIPGLK